MLFKTNKHRSPNIPTPDLHKTSAVLCTDVKGLIKYSHTFKRWVGVHTAQIVCAMGVGRQEDVVFAKKYTELIHRCRQNKRAAVLNSDGPGCTNIIGSLRKEEVRVPEVSPQFISNL